VGERYVYTPYGEVTFLEDDFDVASSQTSVAGSTHLVTGRERDPETGLQLNRHRYYASHLGRWLARDPYEYLDSLSLYEYVRSDPANSVDPYGLACEVCFTCFRIVKYVPDTLNCKKCIYECDPTPNVQWKTRKGFRSFVGYEDCTAFADTLKKLGVNAPKQYTVKDAENGNCPPANDITFCVMYGGGDSPNDCSISECLKTCRKGKNLDRVCRAIKEPALREYCKKVIKAGKFVCENICTACNRP